MQSSSDIREHMQVVSSENQPLGSVDHIDAHNTIKLTKDQTGQHHWIPMNWVSNVDDKVHLNRASEQAMRQWMSQPPEGSQF